MTLNPICFWTHQTSTFNEATLGLIFQEYGMPLPLVTDSLVADCAKIEAGLLFTGDAAFEYDVTEKAIEGAEAGEGEDEDDFGPLDDDAYGVGNIHTRARNIRTPLRSAMNMVKIGSGGSGSW